MSAIAAMRVIRLGHVNIRTDDVAGTVAFYEQLLGLRAGPGASSMARSENVWLHAEDGAALIHVNGIKADEVAAAPGIAGRLDHFALDCTGLEACVARLEAAGISYLRARIETRGLTQLTLADPNRLKVELTFLDPPELA